MCYGCYEEAGKPSVINEEVKKASKMIQELYDHPDCGAGGYAHVVVDDWNLDDWNIDYCIGIAEEGKYDSIDENGRLLCLNVLYRLKKMTVDERYSSLAMSAGFIGEDKNEDQ